MRIEPRKKIKIKRENLWLEKVQRNLALLIAFISVFVFFAKILFF